MKRDSLAKNTNMLLLMTVSNYLIGFVTFPYLARVLGSSAYGIVGFCTSISVVIQIIVDYGFNIYATKLINKCRNDDLQLIGIFSDVFSIKVLISFLIFCACFVFYKYYNNKIEIYTELLVLYIVSGCVAAWFPDFLYRGLEKFSRIAYRTFFVKIAYLILIFKLVKSNNDIYILPILLLTCNAICLVISLIDIRYNFYISVRIPSINNILRILKDGSVYFVSRAASIVGANISQIVMGVLIPGSVSLGYFISDLNLINAGRALCSAVSDALYPYMLRTKKYSVLLRVAICGTSLIVVGSIVVFLISEWLCGFIFGAEYRAGAEFLVLLLPLVLISYLNYIFGFPALSPIGKDFYANVTVVFGLFTQICMICFTYYFDKIDIPMICYILIISEVLVLAFRAYLLFKYALQRG